MSSTSLSIYFRVEELDFQSPNNFTGLPPNSSKSYRKRQGCPDHTYIYNDGKVQPCDNKASWPTLRACTLVAYSSKCPVLMVPVNVGVRSVSTKGIPQEGGWQPIRGFNYNFSGKQTIELVATGPPRRQHMPSNCRATWLEMFPLFYHPDINSNDDVSEVGGIQCQLEVLLGFAALVFPREHQAKCFTACFNKDTNGRWWKNFGFKGFQSRRTIVVTLLARPGSENNTTKYLDELDRGDHGPILDGRESS